MYRVVYVERNKEPMELCHRTNSLKVHRYIGTHSWRMSRMKTKPPHVEQQQWVPVSLKRARRAAEPGANIGVKVNAMFTTDDKIITTNIHSFIHVNEYRMDQRYILFTNKVVQALCQLDELFSNIKKKINMNQFEQHIHTYKTRLNLNRSRDRLTNILSTQATCFWKNLKS